MNTTFNSEIWILLNTIKDRLLTFVEKKCLEKNNQNQDEFEFFEMSRPCLINEQNPHYEIHLAFLKFELAEYSADYLIKEGFRLLMPVISDETKLFVPQKKIYFIFTGEPDEQIPLNVHFIIEWVIISDIELNAIHSIKPTHLSESEKETSIFKQQLYPYIQDMKRYLNPSTKHPKDYPPYIEDAHEGEKYPRYSRVIVGPVHAGIIPPGRFTFDLVGERVHLFKADLQYTHKGIERLCENSQDICKDSDENVWSKVTSIMGSVAGDTSAAYECAYCRAVEFLSQTFPCEQDLWIRAILLELERIANHINDIGLMARGVSFEGPATVCCVLKENIRQWCQELTGSRLLKDCFRLGGIKPEVRNIFLSAFSSKLFPELSTILNYFFQAVEEKSLFWESFWDHSLVRDRTSVGVLASKWVKNFAAPGIVAKSVNLNRDFRLQHPWGPYLDPDTQQILTKKYDPIETNGDVMSRFAVRIREIKQSKDLVEKWQTELRHKKYQHVSESNVIDNLKTLPPYSFHVGHCEGWRGEVVCWVMKDIDNTIFRLKIRDPSMVNWVVMENLMNYEKKTKEEQLEANHLGIACFPLINKSFNLSYSGNDL